MNQLLFRIVPGQFVQLKMEQLNVEDLNCDEILQPTNDFALQPKNTAIPPPPPPPPPLPDEFFDNSWETLSTNEFFVQTGRLNNFVEANRNHPLYLILHCASSDEVCLQYRL